jgi:hypothetical protein
LGELVNLALSKGAVDTLPYISLVLYEISALAVEIDPDIGLSGLYVEGQISKKPTHYSGVAYPSTLSIKRKHTIFHPNGKIALSFARRNSFEEIVRLFGHELRHIGQYHRGRETHECMTIRPLTGDESEEDAYWFEDQLWERI